MEKLAWPAGCISCHLCFQCLCFPSSEVEHLMEKYHTPWLLPKQKIFISHSGKPKDFAQQLCEYLETSGFYPFFNKRKDSLPKGEKFLDLILQAANECLLAIVLISEAFFTRSQWPMVELAAFVQAQKTRKDLCILPMLLDLRVEDIEKAAKWSNIWSQWQKKHKQLTCEVIKEWEEAVKALKLWNMVLKNPYDGEVKLRKDIMKFVYKILPPDN